MDQEADDTAMAGEENGGDKSEGDTESHGDDDGYSDTYGDMESEVNPLSANFTKWSNTLKQFVGNLLTNCLSFLPFCGIGT